MKTKYRSLRFRIVWRLLFDRSLSHIPRETRTTCLLWLIGLKLPRNRALHLCEGCLRQIRGIDTKCKACGGSKPVLFVLHPIFGSYKLAHLLSSTIGR